MRYSIIALLLLGLIVWRTTDSGADAQESTEEASNEQAEPVRHVVWFKYKEGTTEADLKKINDGFQELPQKIDGIRAFEWGVNNSPENLNKGFTHCYLVTFDTAKDRDAYITHEAHQAFVAMLRPHLEEPMVIDYVPQDRYRRRRQ